MLISACVLVSLLFIVNEITQAYDLYDDANTNGIPGYSDDSWKYSPLIAYVNEHANDFATPDNILYSNAHEVICFFTGNTCAELPHYIYKEEITNYMEEDPHYVIWLLTVIFIITAFIIYMI